MSHKQVISAYGNVPFGFLISIPKAVRILLVHRILETSFQLFLVKWACIFICRPGPKHLRIQSFADVPMRSSFLLSVFGFIRCCFGSELATFF